MDVLSAPIYTSKPVIFLMKSIQQGHTVHTQVQTLLSPAAAYFNAF